MFMLNSKMFPVYINNNVVGSLTAWTTTTIATLTLKAGTYIITGEVQNVQTTANVLMQITNTNIAVTGTKNTSLTSNTNGTDIVTISSSTTFNLNVTPDANATGTFKGYLKAVKIGN